jgi:hypothetical protein
MLDDEGDAGQLAPPPGGTGIVVGHIRRQAPACGAPEGGYKLQRFGHEPAMDLTQAREFR